MFVGVESEAAFRCLLWKCWTFTPLSGSHNCYVLFYSVWACLGHMIPCVGALSYTHDRSALILACVYWFPARWGLQLGCFSVMRGWHSSLWCACQRLKTHSSSRNEGRTGRGDPVCFNEGGLRGDQRFFSYWHIRLLVLLELLRGDDADASEQQAVFQIN